MNTGRDPLGECDDGRGLEKENGHMAEGERRALAELLRKHRDAGLTYREMARRALRAGHDISHSQITDLGNDLVRKMPPREHIRAIAAALGVDPAVVLAAAFEQFYGYVPQLLQDGAEPTGAAIPADLTADEREELGRLIQAWVAARHEGR